VTISASAKPKQYVTSINQTNSAGPTLVKIVSIPTASTNATVFFSISSEGKAIATSAHTTGTNNFTHTLSPTATAYGRPTANVSAVPAANVSAVPTANVSAEPLANSTHDSIATSGKNINTWFADEKIYILYGFVGAVICVVPIVILYRKSIFNLVTKKKKRPLLPSISTNPLYTTNNGAVVERRRSISNELIKYNKVKSSPLIRSATCPDMVCQA
jgi:hypothetical protein